MLSLFPESPCPLPDFQSLLVAGSYHASAPIHLAISHARDNPDSRPLVLSPSRSSLEVALVHLSDGWLSSKSRCGNVIEAVSRIDMLFPPTPVHLSMLLSLLRSPASNEEIEASPLNPKTTRVFSPGLVILHEPSRYFTSMPGSHTISSYTSLIAQAFSILAALSGSRYYPRLVVFDSQLCDLTLPAVQSGIADPFSKGQGVDEVMNKDPMLSYVEPFFEFLALVEDSTEDEEDVIPSSQGEDEELTMEEPPLKSIKLMSISKVGEDAVLDTIRWRETRAGGMRRAREWSYFEILD